MEVQELIDRTADELVKRIQASKGLAVFAKRRAKFEGWLKVELIDILLKNGVKDVVPEAGLVDVSFGEVAIELKTVNTNYRDGIADNLIRPITKNVEDVIEDIKNHRGTKSIKFIYKYIIFIVFPLSKKNTGWNTHLQKIEKDLGETCHARYFTFDGTEESVSGCLYFGRVMDGELIC
jgi:hypothetical protein